MMTVVIIGLYPVSGVDRGRRRAKVRRAPLLSASLRDGDLNLVYDL